jgi:hypothetical protein
LSFLFSNKAFGDCIDHRKKNGDPEECAPYQWCDLVLFETKREITDEGRTKQVKTQA